MVPPFLAYYGVVTGNQSLLQAAYDQCRLYRQYLVDEDKDCLLWRELDTLANNVDELAYGKILHDGGPCSVRPPCLRPAH